MDEDERLALLSEAVATPGGLLYDHAKLSEATRETLASFEVMRFTEKLAQIVLANTSFP